MKKTIFLLFALLFTSSLAAQSTNNELTDEENYLDAMHRYITSAKLLGYVRQLSDSSLQGRLAGSPGMEKAVEIVKGYFEEWNLIPGGTNGSYLQEYPHPCVEIKAGSAMSVLFPTPAGKKGVAWVMKEYPWADGWFAGNNSGNGEVTADIVYAGFGVSAPELGYDDYKGINVKGKIVLIEGETPNLSKHPDTIAMWYKHTLHQSKLANAASHGAAGMLYKWVPGPNALYNPDFIYCHITEPVMEDIFLGTGRTCKETVKGIYETKRPASFDTGKKAYMKMISTYNPDATGKNILGIIKGSDPNLTDEYIMISAHLDHLGMIPWHIEGANDNNASSAALLGVAEALSKAAVKPKRSIVFMSVDGEEAGLTGSTFYTQYPVLPKDKMIAILNLEQMGAGEGLAAGYGYTVPGLATFLEKANRSYVHRRLIMYEDTYRTRPRTDGAVFKKAGYPCADLRAVGGGYYHHPKDNVESINPEILQSATEWLYWATILIANEESPDLFLRKECQPSGTEN
ncbi:MAG: M28 family peptidase [Tannerellaceae bacterium]|nr:M28 family peptidase [Tannerellaceae bacterium]